MYNLKQNIRGDFFGGLNAGVVALPLAMAFGVESGLGATAGLVGAIVLSIITALTGATSLMISGPTAAMTLVSSLIIANELERAASTDAALTTLFVIFLLAGFLQVIFGLIRLGKYIRFVPYPIISGFMNGIGIVMVLIQILPLIGHPVDIHIGSLFNTIPQAIHDVNWQAIILGASTIAIVYLFPKITRVIPSTLVAIVVASLAAYLLKWSVPTVGDVSDEWITWRWHYLIKFDHTQWSDVFIPALTIALLGSVDTLLTCLVVDMVTGEDHKSDRELIGQGAGNVLSAIAGGLPGSSAILRTMLSINSGARTRIASLIHSAFLLFVLLEVGNIIHFIPFAVLGGILITVGFTIIDYKGLRDVFKIPKSDALLMLLVMIVTIFAGLLPAFVIGIIFASLSFVKKMANQNIAKTESLLLMPANEVDLSTIEPIYLSREVLIQELSGPLFFGFASYFKEALTALPNTRAVIFRMERVPFIDQSGLYALRDVLKHLRKKEIVLYFTGIQPEPKEQLFKMGIIPELIQESNLFNSFAHAADELEQFLKDNPSAKLKKTTLKEDLDLDQLKDRLN